jgi:hypothetical protein
MQGRRPVGHDEHQESQGLRQNQGFRRFLPVRTHTLSGTYVLHSSGTFSSGTYVYNRGGKTRDVYGPNQGSYLPAKFSRDDRRPWRRMPQALWVRLRLLCVTALWGAHCRRHHGDQTPLVTMIAGLVSRVRELMARDAAFVTPDGPLVATVGGTPFRRRYPPSLGRPFCPAGGIVTPSAPGPRPLRGPSST